MIARLGKCSQWGWMFPTKVDYDSPSPVLAPGPWTMRRYFSVSVNCLFQIFPKYFLNFSTQFCVFGIFLRAGKYFPPSWLWLPLSAAGLWSIRGGGAASWDDHRSPLSNLGLSHNTFHDTVQCHVMSQKVTQYFSWRYNVTLCHTTSHNTFQYTGHSTFLLIVMNYWTNTKHNTGQNTTLDNWPSSVSRDNHQSLCSKSVLSHNVIVHRKKEHQGNIWWTLKNWNQMAPFKNYFATHSRDAKGASQYKKLKEIIAPFHILLFQSSPIYTPVTLHLYQCY